MRRAFLTGIAATALVAVSAGLAPLREVPQTAQRFVGYLHAMHRSGQDLSLWDRVTYGLLLAGSTEQKKGGSDGPALI